MLQQVLRHNGVSDAAFSAVCVAVDKLDKIGEEEVTHFFRCTKCQSM